MAISKILRSKGRRVLHSLANRNYYSARAYQNLLLSYAYSRNPQPLLVFQMGKVGSKSIVESLQASSKRGEFDTPVYHLHYLSDELIDRYEKIYKKTWPEGYVVDLWRNQFLRRKVDRGLEGKRWKIVTLTRDPIARNLSAFCQDLRLESLDSGRTYKVKSVDYGFEITVELEDMGELINLFYEKFYHNRPKEYFDRELKSVFDVDVFSCEFPHSRGYKIYEEKSADVLLIRLENLNDCAHQAFEEFLGLDDFTLNNANISSEKPHSSFYRKFYDSIHLRDSYVEEMYSSTYARHFYTSEELDGFRAKWH